MKRSEISRAIDQLDVDPESIADLKVKQSLVTLLNPVLTVTDFGVNRLTVT